MQKNKQFNCSELHVEALEKIKKENCNTVTNHHFDVNPNTRVKCDASHLGLGASVPQNHGGICKTVAFASRILNLTTARTNLNCWAVWALDHFKNYL